MRPKQMARTLSLALLAVAAAVALATRVSGQHTSSATFDIPFDKLPGGRMDAKGNLDPTSSPEDAHAGAFVAAKKLGLFRNFEWLHWVPTAPSKRDADDRRMERRRPRRLSDRVGIDGPRHRRRLPVLGPQQLHEHHRPGRDPRREDLQDPGESGKESAGRGRQMPQLTVDNGKTAVRDRELRPYNYTSTRRRRADADGPQRRDRHGRRRDHVHAGSADVPAGGRRREGAQGVLAHEFYLWHDPRQLEPFPRPLADLRIAGRGSRSSRRSPTRRPAMC